jgi:NAD(P)H dehydrogenase (quinone)
MTLVITGASGQLGRRTAELVLDHPDHDGLVLVTRRPDGLADLAARGATVRVGDFSAPETLGAAFAGGDRLLLISTDVLGDRLRGHLAAVEAARAAGIQHLAYTSVLDPVADNPAAVVPDHLATEQAITASGLAWTFLRNALYAEFRQSEAEAAIAAGELTHNFATGRHAFVSREDCAATAAAVLAGGPEHDGVAYDVTGPELLGGDELAATYSALGGRAVRAVAVDDEALISGLVAAGVPRAGAEVAASLGAALRAGYMAQLSTVVDRLTGRPAASLESVLRAGDAAASQ